MSSRSMTELSNFVDSANHNLATLSVEQRVA